MKFVPFSFLSDSELDIQEQGFNILRNLAENEEGIAMVFREIPQVLSKLVDGMRSTNEDVVLQSTYALANLANGTHGQQDMIVKHPHLLSALQLCLAESNSAVRRPAVSCILTLVESNPKRRKEMNEAGIISSLRSLCDWSGHPPPQPHDSHGHSSAIGGPGGSAASLSHAIGVAPGGNAPYSARSSVRSFVGGLNSAGVLGGTYGSWAGSGALHMHYGTGRHGLGTNLTDGRSGSQLVLDDEHDVIQRAREALGWLDHGDSFATATP